MSSVSLDVQKPQSRIPSAKYDAIVVGAGPYGLSITTHLMERGLKVATFGKPIHFWRAHMPEGMLLRSFWWATNLSDPEVKYCFKNYFQEKGVQATDPLPIETFIDYGLWFQKNAVPQVDETYVTNIRSDDGQFVVTLEDGRVLQSKAVVIAPGLQYYKHIPPEYAHLPASLMSHSSDHHVMNTFANKKVVLIGRGQGSLETAALFNENGTDVHVVARHPIRWVQVSHAKLPPFFRELRAPRAGMGNGWLNLILEKYPYAFQRLPQPTRDHLLETRHGPAGADWLKPRILNNVTIHEQVQVEKIEEAHGQAKVALSNGRMLEGDHVIFATGYQADIQRLPMMDASLTRLVQTHKQAPILSSWFESSVPGLYFVGFTAARSLGFLYRFVHGTDAAALRVTSALAGRIARHNK